MQPYILPYIGYWQLISAVDKFIIYDDVKYINKGYINRNSILLNGQPYRFTIQLRGASQNKLINEIEIGDNLHKIMQTIEQAYRKATYYSAVIPLLFEIFSNNDKNLSRFIGKSIEIVCKYLDIRTKIIYSSNIKKNNALTGQEKIIDINKLEGSNMYINPIGGQKLYDRKIFENAGIDLKFLLMDKIQYGQNTNVFIENLSIIDVLMHAPKYEIIEMLGNYSLL